MLKNLSDITKKIILVLLFIFIALSILGFFFRNLSGLTLAFGNVPFINYQLGLAFGTIYSAIKIILLEKTLEKAVKLNPADAQNYVRVQYIVRYTLTFIALIVAALIKPLDLLGAILGILSLQLATYIAGFSIKDEAEFKEENNLKKETKLKKDSEFKKMRDEFKL
ncbi:MAG: ATP synthase subunit I [Lachnospirales bacterium]